MVDPGGAAPLERAIARVLFWGGVVSITIAVLGAVLHIVLEAAGGPSVELAQLLHRQETGHSPLVFTSLAEIVHALGRRPPEPLALTALALLLLLVTPIVGVAVALVGFVRAGDREYAIITAIVLGMLVVSFFLAGGAG